MKKVFGSFRFKIIFLISICSVMTVLVVMGSFYVINAVENKLNFANEERVPLAQLTNQMAANLNAVDRYYWNSIAEANPVATIRLAGLAADEMASFENNLEAIKKRNLENELLEKMKLVQDRWPKLKEKYGHVNAESEKGTSEGFKSAKESLIQTKALAAEITEGLSGFNETLVTNIKKGADEDHTFLAKSKKIMSIMSGLTVLALLFLCIIALNAGKQIAKTLGAVITHLKASSREVEMASQHLNTSALQLSSESRRTAKSVEETVTFAKEVTAMVQQNAESAKRAATIANDGNNEAKVGEEKISKLYHAVGGVAKTSKKIEEMVSVIEDIAFQTNILALNAAVEAARAGDQGKGFAVVADAVRSLAQKSAVAAKDITGLIQSSVEQIETSFRLADEGKKSLTEIVGSILQISELNAKIATASEEQASSLTNISKNMIEIDRSTQDNVNASEKISETSEELSAQSLGLNEQVEGLVVLVDGKSNKAA